MSRVHGILMLILKGKHLLIKLFIQCIKFLLFRCFSCWLSGKLIWAFAAPVLFVILVSTFSLRLLFTVYQKDLPDHVFSVYKLVPLVARFINASRVNRTINSTWPDLGLSMYTYIMLDFRKRLCYNRLLPSSSFFRSNISKLDNKKLRVLLFLYFSSLLLFSSFSFRVVISGLIIKPPFIQMSTVFSRYVFKNPVINQLLDEAEYELTKWAILVITVIIIQNISSFNKTCLPRSMCSSVFITWSSAV